MKVLRWTPDFNPEQETSIVKVWILIHKLPWHLFSWEIVSRLVKSIGTAVAPDQATYSKTRGNVAKVRWKLTYSSQNMIVYGLASKGRMARMMVNGWKLNMKEHPHIANIARSKDMKRDNVEIKLLILP